MSEPTPIRLVLVEPYRLIRDALQSLLQTDGTVIVVGEASGTQELLDTISAHRPDMALISLDGWNDRDLALLRALPEVSEQIRTLVLTGEPDPALHAKAIQLGARGVLPKNQSGPLLIKAVQKVHAGQLWLDRLQSAEIVNRLMDRHVEEDPDSTKIASLTPRECQIIGLVAKGLKNKGIAQRLVISDATVRNHLTSILDKLELNNRFRLAVFAFRKGLVPASYVRAASWAGDAQPLQPQREMGSLR